MEYNHSKNPFNSEFVYSGTEILKNHERLLKNYNRAIVESFILFPKKIDLNFHPKLVLDFGAGIGTLAEIYFSKTKIRPLTVEISEAEIKLLSIRGFDNEKDILNFNHNFDLIYTRNVLEHIENDVEALKNIRRKMGPNKSFLAIYVPAFPILFSHLDREVGHFRRYTRIELKNKIIEAGFDVELIEYSDSLGFLASLILKITGFTRLGNHCGTKSLEIYDKVIFPISRILDKLGARHVFGKNLIMIASHNGR